MNKDLLDILICPKSGGTLEYNEENKELICKESNLAYPVIDGIPIMLVEKAREINKGK
ncbi:MAG: Trm112 family protein [Gammaproteobacteria bacterium]